MNGSMLSEKLSIQRKTGNSANIQSDVMSRMNTMNRFGHNRFGADASSTIPVCKNATGGNPSSTRMNHAHSNRTKKQNEQAHQIEGSVGQFRIHGFGSQVRLYCRNLQRLASGRLAPDSFGEWALGDKLTLLPGNYEYCLVVDGEWRPDPQADETIANPFGGLNSVLKVAATASPQPSANERHRLTV